MKTNSELKNRAIDALTGNWDWVRLLPWFMDW